MATLKIYMCSACSFVIPTMQPGMTAADLLAQWMSSASHNTPASAPFLSTFSQTPQQHYPAGHTLPQSMQPQCTTAAFTQPFAPTFAPTPQQQQPQPLGHTVPQPTQAPFSNSAFTQPPSFHAFNTTSQHSHAMSSATTTLQRSHTQSSALTTTIWIIRHLPVYTTVNKHDTSTTTTSHTSFTAISNHYSFNSTMESQQAQPYTISHHTQEAQIHYQATQPTQIYETTSLTSQITPQIHHTTFQTPQITTPITTSTPASFTSQATSLKH